MSMAAQQDLERAKEQAILHDNHLILASPISSFTPCLFVLQVCVLTAQEQGWALDQIPQDEAMDAIVNATYDARYARQRPGTFHSHTQGWC